MLVPRSCVVCRRIGPGLCAWCVQALQPSLSWRSDGPVDAWAALFAYDGVGAAVIQRIKYANHRDAIPQLAVGMARLFRHGSTPAQIVTWAPTSPSRRRHRGFDQAELLAVAIAGELGVPAGRLLSRAVQSAQTGRNRVARAGVEFSCARPLGAHRPVPPSVLLVDDVRTTGATLRAAAQALRAGGADHVRAVVVADRR